MLLLDWAVALVVCCYTPLRERGFVLPVICLPGGFSFTSLVIYR